MAAQEPPGSEQGAAPEAVLGDGLRRVFGTRRSEPATAWNHRRNHYLIDLQEEDDDAADHAAARGLGMLSSALRRSVATAAIGSLSVPTRPITTSATSAGAASRVSRYASRRRRFTR